MGHSRHTCDGDHRLVLPCLLYPFAGPCASMAATAAITLNGSEAVTSLMSGSPKLHWAIRQRCCSSEGECREVTEVPEGLLETWRNLIDIRTRSVTVSRHLASFSGNCQQWLFRNIAPF